MGKFRVEVYDAEDLENVYECEMEELGQAMIQVMNQGHELYEVLKTENEYHWKIENFSDDIKIGSFYIAYGTFSNIGSANIARIITYK